MTQPVSTDRRDVPAGQRHSILGWPQLLGLGLVLLVLHEIARENFLLFHVLSELLRIVILGGVFVLAWHTRAWTHNGFLLTVGMAAFWIAGLELLHTLTYKGMGLTALGGVLDDPDLPTQLWVGFRLLEAVAFLLAALLARSTVQPLLLFGGFGLATAALLGSILIGVFPTSFVEGDGLTRFKVVAEYTTIGLFALAIVLLLRQRAHFDPGVHIALVASLLFAILTSLAFTRYGSVFDMANEVGHYLLLISAYLVYRALLATGLVAPFALLFHTQKQHEAELEALVEERTARLVESQSLNHTFIEHSPAVIFLTDLEGRYTLVNPAFETLIGRSREAIIGQTVFDLMPTETAAEFDRNNRAARRSGKPTIHSETLDLDDAFHLFETVHFPLFDNDGQLVGSGGIATEVTEHRKSEARYELMIRTSMDAVVLIGDDGQLIEVNEAACELTGYDCDELLGMDVSALDTAGRTEIARQMEHIRGMGAARFERQWRRKDGTVRDIEVSVNVLSEGRRGNVYFSFIRDITERKATMERIEHMAHYDALTELPNRALFEQLAPTALGRTRVRGRARLLFYLDLDNFKDINDSLGHLAGDELLREMARRLWEFPADDRVICRFGGDEFLMLVEVNHDLDIASYAHRLRNALGQPLVVEEHQIVATASIGVTSFPADGEDLPALLRNADMALHAAKDDGRNTHRVFTPAMREHATERIMLISKLRSALANDEFELNFQPQIDLASGRIVGAEALLRWNQPELGRVPPGRFIPLAEESGLIIDIGAWVIEQAIATAAAWRSRGLGDIVMAINISALQFRHGNLARDITNALTRARLPGANLEVELTESTLIDDTDRLEETIALLKRRDVKLAIDDFGTGYSGLTYLRRFAVDRLKVDQSFVRDIGQGDSAALVTAVIQMAHSLGLTVIAEGVETQTQSDQLLGLRCDQAQGYRFGRPMTAAAFESLLIDQANAPPTTHQSPTVLSAPGAPASPSD
ncbi:EAL domain-containing protein [Guyparkeria hydrothermalis]|uniref:bifunctional diguanylate cyclase/phosphodiesterase n=1 Tax=Guyparkeria TaxID=2035712 RepID=UPI0010AD2AEA|nr:MULTISPECIES: EAL domain-containing protein [Guyparkeria]MCL7751421.1 EAL domain-containing protein [Guyparkeria hydrothermalis]TKA91855.1 EAL domain-containing protein [Guyparkeria sp. SB14A]